MKRSLPRAATALAALVCAASLTPESRALTVRVDPSGGAPRLVVDGRPVRARVFWGAPGSSPIPVGPEWMEVRFEFVARHDAAAGTMHFRFGQEPGEVALDDVRVTDLDTGADLVGNCDFETGPAGFTRDWTVWPTGAANTVGQVRVAPGAGRDGTAGLLVSLAAPKSGEWPDFHVYHLPRLAVKKGHHYRVTLQARATPARALTVAFYRPGASYVLLGGPPDRFASQIRLAAGAGVDIVSFPADLPWPRAGEPADWSMVDDQCQAVLDANPRALLLPRMGMDPPAWWRDAHPDDVMKWDDGHRGPAVVASPLYRREAAARLHALVEHLEARFGGSVAGYHPCGQNTGEWFYQDTWLRPLNGYATADLTAWRGWLKSKYRSDATLAAAWRDPAATLAGAAVPTAAARRAAPSGILRDPATERPLVDWAAFQQEAMAGCVTELAHAARTASHGRKLVVFFYGYGFEFAAIENGPATSGHYAFRRLLDCPDVDVLCSPISYHDRGVGQGAPAMSAAESVALAGKLWLNEDDTHTYLATGNQPGWTDHAADIGQTNGLLTRNVAQEALRNFGTWWMDLGASGWFDDPAMWAVMKRLEVLDLPLLKTPTPYRPEVAAVLDERSLTRVAAGGVTVTRPGVYEARTALGRMGAPYGQYLLDDVTAGKVHARVYVFLDAWCLDAAQRTALRRATRGAANVWCYAPAAQDENRPTPAAMSELTGFRVRPVEPRAAVATPTAAGRRLGLGMAPGVAARVRPLFAAADATGDEVLATFPDGSAAIALRRTGDGVSLFAGAPGLTPDLLRVAARAGRAHLFTETDCNVYASGPYVVLHAARDGDVTLRLPRGGAVRDLMTDRTVGEGPRLSIPLRKGETRVLQY